MKLLERKLSAKSHEQQQQVEELETSVGQFRHELQISEQSIESKELNAMHEKLHKERKYRSLPKQYDALVAEDTSRVTKLEICDNTAAMDTARNHLHVSDQMMLKLEIMQDELAARANEVFQHESDLAVEDDELLRAQEDAD
ncbi:hypothetical protein PsorP6_018793 [Peronosclerospora sorghi]|nr:hypothetical protein PsorP6_018793 [Peronosclerospora sorghi]